MGYPFNIKELRASLNYINVIVEDDDMVQICIDGLTHNYSAFGLVNNESPSRRSWRG